MESAAAHSSPNWIFAFATVLWAIMIGLILRLLIVALEPLLGGPSALLWLQSTPFGLAMTAAIIQLGMAAVVLVRARDLPGFWQRLYDDGRRRKSRAGWALLLVLGIGPLANVAGLGAAKLFGSDLGAMRHLTELIRRATLSELVTMGLVLTVLPALVEESLFRGLVQRSLAGARWSLVIGGQALAFGCFHLDVAQGVATAILGLAFGLVADWTGSLVGAVIAHGGYNLMVLLSQRYLEQVLEGWHWQLLTVTIGALLAAWAVRQLVAKRVTEVNSPS